jgi:hypothetical protein
LVWLAILSQTVDPAVVPVRDPFLAGAVVVAASLPPGAVVAQTSATAWALMIGNDRRRLQRHTATMVLPRDLLARRGCRRNRCLSYLDCASADGSSEAQVPVFLFSGLPSLKVVLASSAGVN